MAIRLIVKGLNLEQVDHNDLAGRSLSNQHPINSISGLDEALDNIRKIALKVNEHQQLGNLDKSNQHPIDAIIGLAPLIELFMRDLTGVFNVTSDSPLIKNTLYNNIYVYDDKYYIAPDKVREDKFIDYEQYNSTIDTSIVDDYRRITNKSFKIYIAKTITNYLNIFNDKDVIAIDTNVSVINGVYKPLWSTSYNKPILNYKFTTPFYINRISLLMNNVKYKISYVKYNDEIKVIDNKFKAVTDNKAEVFIIDTWVKSLEIYVVDYYDSAIKQYTISNISLITNNIFTGSITYRLDLSKLWENPCYLNIENANIDYIKYRKDLNLTEIKVDFCSQQQIPVQINDIEISYHQNICQSFQDIMLRLYTLDENLNQLIESVNKTKIDNMCDMIDKAINKINPNTGIVYNTLDERLNTIENTYFNKYVDNLNEYLTNITENDKHMLYTVTSPITVIELPFKYPVNTNRLKVYLDGVKLECGENQDYIEVSNNTIMFNYTIEPIIDENGITLDREIVIEYLSLNPIINVHENGEVMTYMPKLYRLKNTITVDGYDNNIIELYTGINQFNIKNIVVKSNIPSQFYIEIYDNKLLEYALYKSRVVNNILCVNEDILYYDNDEQCKLYIKVYNKYNNCVEYNITINGLQIDSAGNMDYAYNKLLSESLATSQLTPSYYKILDIENSIKILNNNVNSVENFMHNVDEKTNILKDNIDKLKSNIDSRLNNITEFISEDEDNNIVIGSDGKILVRTTRSFINDNRSVVDVYNVEAEKEIVINKEIDNSYSSIGAITVWKYEEVEEEMLIFDNTNNLVQNKFIDLKQTDTDENYISIKTNFKDNINYKQVNQTLGMYEYTIEIDLDNLNEFEVGQ